jgi:hypothetical protein
MSWRTSTVVGIVAMTWSMPAFGGTKEVHFGQLKSKPETTTVRSAPTRPGVEKPAKLPPISIAKVRLDPAPPGEKKNSAVLKFQVSNESSNTLTDIVFEISIVEELQREHLDTPSRVLAGPFEVRGTIVLDPGYTADCEVLLRNVSSECSCGANVRVLSVRALPDSGS